MVKKTGRKMIDQLDGKITLLFSWNPEAFLRKGFGYAAVNGDTPVSLAFSASVSNYEVDMDILRKV